MSSYVFGVSTSRITIRYYTWHLSFLTEAQRELRQMENKWWIERAQEIQQYADANEG